jgi:two-component system, chemotaxis family, protein-glutamate methylesterase/glutaminase
VQLESSPRVTASPRRVIAVAASAGGVEALQRLVAHLPADLDAAVCIVLHIPSTGRSLLAPILGRATRLTVVLATDGAPLHAGTVYVAPADRHLLIGADRISLSSGPRENGVRPAADPMFRSLARSWGSAAVAVVLSGALDDGATGALAVAQAGGRVIVQDPDDALVPSMPVSAMAVTGAHDVLPVAEIGEALRRYAETPVAPSEAPPEEPELRSTPSGFSCPECRGVLWELRERDVVRYRCRVGHIYSEEAMVSAQGTAVEAALWSALEALEERSELLLRIAKRMGDQPRSHQRFTADARAADQRAAIIRRILHGHDGTVR